MNFVKFLRISFLQNTSERLLLLVVKQVEAMTQEFKKMNPLSLFDINDTHMEELVLY